jgi:hypothetical protein
VKKIYIASRYRHKVLVKKLLENLEKRGYISVTSWVDGKDIPKPYSLDVEGARDEAINATDGSNSCDVFVLISDEQGTWMYTELGIALGRAARGEKVAIYVVGEHGANSVFSYHPAVEWLKSTQELLKILR